MRLLKVVALLLIVAVLALTGGAVYLIRRPFPQTSGTVVLAGVGAPVEIVRDRWGVPHIFAQTADDLFFAQGYVHAQDRLWQMELFRRTASGRLSEIFGAVTLDVDRLMRVVGLRRSAEANIGHEGPEGAAALRAYSRGINAFVEGHRHRLPIEFTLLRFQPEPWSPIDSLAFGRFMAWAQSGNWRSELLRSNLAARFGTDGPGILLPASAPGTPAIITGAAAAPSSAGPGLGPGAQAATGGAGAPLTVAGIPFAATLSGLPGAGSNNWVVGPSRSASGGALLANDPHLEAQMPGIWYETHLSGGGYDVVGASLPGIPGIIIGHNAHVAWGVTTAYPDVQDLYVERFHPRDPDRYLAGGVWTRARVIREEIRVKGRDDTEILVVRITRHGPILNPAVRGLGAFVALRWTGHDPDRVVDSLVRLNTARNWEEFRAALAQWSVPTLNFVYADRQGNIGYLMAGRVPVRPAGIVGDVPIPGWTDTGEWLGSRPADEVPHQFNPAGGLIITANNRITPPTSAREAGDEFDPGFRALRIASLLAARRRHTLDDLARIQQDLVSLPAQRFVAAWQDVRIQEEGLGALFEELRRWDGVVRPDSRAALTFEALLTHLMREVFKDALDGDVLRRYLRRYDAPVLMLLEMSARPADPWWGEDGRDRMIEHALGRAADDLERRLGRDRARWRWGRVHTPVFVHPLGRLRGLGWIFNATPPPVGGDAFTVNVSAFDPEDPYQGILVPSYRLLVDTRDWSARSMHTTGQSGLPFHRHYRSLVRAWARGEYHPLLFTRTEIDRARDAVLRVMPPQ